LHAAKLSIVKGKKDGAWCAQHAAIEPWHVSPCRRYVLKRVECFSLKVSGVL
jgi:hypothetical protein